MNDGTFRLRRLRIETQRERIIVIHGSAVAKGSLGFNPTDRARVIGKDPQSGQIHDVSGVLGFCSDTLIDEDEIGLTEDAFRDLGLPEGSPVSATLAVAPASVDLVRNKLRGARLDRGAFDAILTDVVHHRYSRVELAMFVMACAVRTLDLGELVDFTRAMVATGSQLHFGNGTIIDKHCIGGIPGNRTTMIVVPILASLGLTVPKTSSRAITSPAGTADTMGILADLALGLERMRKVVERTGACIAWGGALELAPGRRHPDHGRAADGDGHRGADGRFNTGQEKKGRRDPRVDRYPAWSDGEGAVPRGGRTSGQRFSERFPSASNSALISRLLPLTPPWDAASAHAWKLLMCSQCFKETHARQLTCARNLFSSQPACSRVAAAFRRTAATMQRKKLSTPEPRCANLTKSLKLRACAKSLRRRHFKP